MIDASLLTPEQRRELMPECAKFLEAMKKHFTFEEIKFQENGYEFEWRKNEVDSKTGSEA